MNFLHQLLPDPPPVYKANGAASGHAVNHAGITSAIELITPERAREFLAVANPHNRKVSKTALIKYGRDMKEGRWTLTGEPIIFDQSGMLADGHHRLMAAVEYQAAFQSIVVRGVPTAAIARIDGGRVRTAADMATMVNIPNASTACAIMTLILIHERHGAEYMVNSNHYPSKSEIVDALRQYPYMELCVSRAASIKNLAPRSIGGFCWHVFQIQDRQKADRFFSELAAGENLSAGNPVLLLRNRLIDNASSRSKLPNLFITALMFKAWAAYRDGKKLKILRWVPDGSQPEKFPQI